MKINKLIERYLDPRYFLILYLAALLIITFTSFRSFSADNVFVLLFGLALLTKRARQYLKDWLPFVLFILGYEALRGVADNLARFVHIEELINLEKGIFRFIPTVWLQARLHPSTAWHWYDFMGLLFYSTHFVFSFAVAYWLWLKNRPAFKFFVRGFLIMCFTGLFTYLLYPAMPPWLASDQGYLPPIQRLLLEIARHFFPSGIDLGTVYRLLSANPIAAFPSLHAAWPFFSFLVLFHFYRHKVWPFIIISGGVWFNIVYFGEHYVVDVLAGIVYAAIGFWLSALWVKGRLPQ